MLWRGAEWPAGSAEGSRCLLRAPRRAEPGAKGLPLRGDMCRVHSGLSPRAWGGSWSSGRVSDTTRLYDVPVPWGLGAPKCTIKGVRAIKDLKICRLRAASPCPAGGCTQRVRRMLPPGAPGCRSTCACSRQRVTCQAFSARAACCDGTSRGSPSMFALRLSLDGQHRNHSVRRCYEIRSASVGDSPSAAR